MSSNRMLCDARCILQLQFMFIHSHKPYQACMAQMKSHAVPRGTYRYNTMHLALYGMMLEQSKSIWITNKCCAAHQQSFHSMHLFWALPHRPTQSRPTCRPCCLYDGSTGNHTDPSNQMLAQQPYAAQHHQQQPVGSICIWYGDQYCSVATCAIYAF